jgi:signal transduction histidine kinase
LIGYTGEKFITENVGNVYALLADRIGRFWVGSGVTAHFRNSISEPWQDVSKVFPGTDPGAVAVISEDRSGSIWIGGSNGLFRIRNGETHKFTTADGLPGNDVTSFLEVSSGRYLVGTVTGLGVVDGEDATAVTTADGLSGNFIRSLYKDSDGTVWIGTYDSGLTRLKDGHYSAIASGNGLFSDGVFCILEDDDGWFWMSSNQGIYRVRKDELNAVADGRSASVTSISYGPEDGLRNVEANGGRQPAGYRSRDGRLWFATAGGLAMIDPRKIRQSSTEPPVLIEEISIDQKPVKPENDSIRIEPGQSSLDVAYTALKFRGAERIRFHYRLEGLDDNWTEAGTRRTANFTSLPYGDYTLRVAALSPDGTWSKEGATLRITVVAPFYKTRWFMALAVTVAILLVGGIFLFRMRQLEAINAAQSEFAQRLIDSQEQERSRIALELHDSLGQSLAVIRNRALMGLSTPENNRQLIEQMAEISEASASALEDTRHIAHNLHPYQLEHLGLTLAVRSLVHSVATTSDLVITSDIQEIDADLPPEAAINIYRIAQESLSNIIKHSHADRAEFSLFEVAGKLVLTISDNGQGFDPSSRSRGLGLNGINERAKILKADLKVHSEPGKGTTIVLSYGIPINGNGKADPRLDRG